MVVDDDDLNREVMEAFLSLDGYSVQLTGNGKNALDLAHRIHCDLIILDVRLPDISGIEICRQLKNDPTTSHIPVMMITGLTDTRTRQEAESVGVDLFFPRPFDGEAFLQQVHHLLPPSN